MARYIFDQDPDPVALMDELFHGGARDYKGLALGNVDEHCTGRLVLSYQLLRLFEVARYHMRFTPPVQVTPIGAEYQDKQTTQEFPAAHRLPCDLEIVQGARPACGLYDLYQNIFCRVWIRRHVFAATDRVHRFVNVADSTCERGPNGMARVLARACAAIANSSADPDTVFTDVVVPGYAAAARAKLQRLQRGMSVRERQETETRLLVDRHGRPFSARHADQRLTSPDPAARAEAKVTLQQILTIYADAGAPPAHMLAAAAAQAEAHRQNEFVRA